MTEAIRNVRGSLLRLPGFLPDAVSYACRFTMALLLSYFVSFAMQLSTAPSTGICVAIVMQPSPGMAASKAFYRVLGTLLGGVVALLFVAAFPQNRTMMLIAFALWLGACTYVASLLRDFRAYGATLAGYTVSIIAILGIDDPSGALLLTLNRVAATLVGVVCVGLVNAVFTADTAHGQLCADLRRHLDNLQATGRQVLDRQVRLEEEACLQQATDILALRTLATYATAELADGLRQNRAAQGAIGAMLAMLAATRTLSQYLNSMGDVVLPSMVEEQLGAASNAVQGSLPAPSFAGLPADPCAAMLLERASTLATAHWEARAWLAAAVTGVMNGLPAPGRLTLDPDRVAALLNAVRVMIAIAFAATFCVLGNDRSVGLVLVIMSALVALLGTQPNPSAAVTNFLPAVPVAALFAGVISFEALPLVSGFAPFALAVAPGVFALSLASRFKGIERFGQPMLVYFAVLLAPSNTETFDIGLFANTAIHLALAIGFTALAFRVVLPVSPGHRLFRVVEKIASLLRHTLLQDGRQDGWLGGHQSGRQDQAAHQSASFDRLSQALTWSGAGGSRRRIVLARAYGFAELDAALRRAWSRHDGDALAAAGLSDATRGTRAGLGSVGLASGGPDALERAARAILAEPAASSVPGAAMRVVSGLCEAAMLLRRQDRALRRYGVLEG